VDSVSQIKINGETVSDNVQMANSFFTSVGKKISNSVPPVTKKPEDYVDYGRDIPLLQLGNTTPEHVLKIIKKFKYFIFRQMIYYININMASFQKNPQNII
jgi:hypothetical protein